MSIPQEDVQLARRQRLSRFGSIRPPTQTPFREAFQDQEESLAIINEQLQRRAPTVGEDEQRSHQRVFIQPLTAQPDQPIDALAEIDRLHGQ
jgi:hypothetical protein